MLKNFYDFLNENLEYTDFFGKKVSHKDALQKDVRDFITQIIVDELGISEKSFSQYDQVIENVKDMCDSNPEIYENAELYYNKGKRLQYFAEKIYDKYFKSPKEKVINEMLEDQEDVKGKVERSKKLNPEMKEKILPLIINGQTEYKKGKVYRLNYNQSKGCDLGADKNGFFVHTHRARSKSHPEINKIPEKDIKFIESTG